VTDAEGRKRISDVKINYKINNSGWWSIRTYSGEWSIWADEGDRVTIWAQKNNFSFQPSPYDIEVTGDRSDLIFELSRWQDDFSDPGSGWDLKNENAGYYEGEYWLEVIPPGYTSIKTLAPYAAPTSYSIEADMEASGDGCYGFVFNITDHSDYYHIFRVCPQGNKENGYVPFWELCKAIIEGYTPQGVMLKLEREAWGQDASRIRIKKEHNRLKVEQNWREIRLYIGSGSEPVWVDEIDTEVTDAIKYGLYASINSGNPYVAYFDDFIFTAIGFKKVKLQTSQFSTLSIPTQNLITSKDIEL